MTWAARPIAVATLAMCATIPVGTRVGQEQSPTFRTVVEAVRLDVLAHRSGQPISGLDRRDFVVLDNGVEQRIESMSTTDSAHVIIGLDVSASVDGETLQQLRMAVRAVTSQLTDRDRVSVFTFADRLQVLARAAHAAPELGAKLDGVGARGSTTLHDAVLLGSLLSHADDRPALLLLFTDGEDTASWTTVTRALDVLRRTAVVVYPVGAGLLGSTASSMDSRYFRQQTWIAPTAGDTLRMLQQLAGISGGQFLRVDKGAAISDTFRAILAQYRQRYLITFTPSDTSKPGWHRLDVKLRNRAGRVVAREGYVAK